MFGLVFIPWNVSNSHVRHRLSSILEIIVVSIYSRTFEQMFVHCEMGHLGPFQTCSSSLTARDSFGTFLYCMYYVPHIQASQKAAPYSSLCFLMYIQLSHSTYRDIYLTGDRWALTFYLSHSLSITLSLSPFVQAHRCPESNADGYYSSTSIWALETHCSLYVSLIIMIHRQSVLSAVQALQKCSLFLRNRQRCRERTEWGFFTVWQWLQRAWLSFTSPHLPLLHFISTSPALPSLTLCFGNLIVCTSNLV